MTNLGSAVEAECDRERWFAVGDSISDDATTAGTEAVEAALAGRHAAAIIVFASASYDAAALLDAIRRAAGPDTIIVGGSSFGEFSPSGPRQNSVVAAAFGGKDFAVVGRYACSVRERGEDAGAEVARAVNGLNRPYSALVMLCDGTSGNQQDVIRGAYSVLGPAVPLVGGCTSSPSPSDWTVQFYGDAVRGEIMSDSVVALAIGSTAPMGIGVAHGWRRSEPGLIVTRGTGGRIDELDGEPALDVYLRRVGLCDDDIADRARFRTVARRHPFGVVRRSGDDIRVLWECDRTTRALFSPADVPQGALLWMMETDDEALAKGAIESCSQALGNLQGRPALGLVAFDCAARWVTLGAHGVRHEIEGVRQAVGDIPFGGFYTTGEIARARGSVGLHHLTFVAFAVA